MKSRQVARVTGLLLSIGALTGWTLSGTDPSQHPSPSNSAASPRCDGAPSEWSCTPAQHGMPVANQGFFEALAAGTRH